MSNKTCINCPGATDHDTAHCPLRVIRLGDLNPEQRLALARGHRPGQAEGAQGEREAFDTCCARMIDCTDEVNRDWLWRFVQRWDEARAALAQPSPECAQGEREAFDAAYARGDFYVEEQRSEIQYQDYRRHQAFVAFRMGWRAALAQPSPAPELNAIAQEMKPLPAEFAQAIEDNLQELLINGEPAPGLERPEVVAHFAIPTGGSMAGEKFPKVGPARDYDAALFKAEDLILLSEFDRIVGALRDEIESERKLRRDLAVALSLAKDNAKDIRHQRDAAQARVAELEHVLAPFAEVADAYDPAEDDSFQPWKDASDIDFLRLTLGQHRAAKAALGATAPVAQAGQVPDIERALAGMLFAFDDGVGQDWSADLLDFARKLVKAKEFAAAPAQGGRDE